MGNIAPRYYINLKDSAGTKLAIFDIFESIHIEHRVNGIGSHEIVFIDNGDSRFDLFALDGRIEVYRSVPGMGVAPYCEYQGFHRWAESTIDDNGVKRFVVHGFDYNDLLARRHIAYKEGTVRSEKNDYAEDVIKEYVRENCGVDASHASRSRDGVLADFAVEAESASHADTPTWTGKKAFEPVLDTIQEIANYSAAKASSPTPRAVDFRVDPDGNGFIFRTYLDQLGTDRTFGNAAAVVFAPELYNLTNITFSENHSSEINSAIVLGMGELSTRTVIVRENATGGALTPWNDIEMVVSAASNEFTYQLNDAGDAALKENAYRLEFDGSPLQTESALYGLHYFLGDLVSVRRGTSYLNKKIIEVTVDIDVSGEERIGINWKDVTV